MKQLLLTLFIAFSSVPVFSQAFGLQVKNTTYCTVYYKIVGDELCECGEAYSSSLFSLPPGGAAFYPNSTGLGGTFPGSVSKSMVAAYIYGNPYCSSSISGVVGEDRCSYPYLFTYFGLYDDCLACATVHAKWISAEVCNADALLIFSL